MHREGSYEYQRDVYLRMMISIMHIHSDKFHRCGAVMSCEKLYRCIEKYYNIGNYNHVLFWVDKVVNDYPDIFIISNDVKAVRAFTRLDKIPMSPFETTVAIDTSKADLLELN